MAKKIKAEDAVPGRFYKHRGKVVFCVADVHGKKGEYPFQFVGCDSRFGIYCEKIKPLPEYNMSKISKEAKLKKLAKKIEKVLDHVSDVHGEEFSIVEVEVRGSRIVVHTGDYI